MAETLKLYVFGDQTYDTQPHLTELLQHRGNPILDNLLEQIYNGLRVEIHKLPPHILNDLPRFTSIEDVLLWSKSGKRYLPLDMALTCTYQLATFITNSDSWYADVTKSRVIGLCTGALSAAVLSCSRNLLDFSTLAVQAVTVAFRTGVVVNNAVKSLSTTESSDQSWSMIVPDAATAAHVRSFCEQSTLPVTSQPYISASASSWCTVSGPPSSLQHLLKSNSFNNIRCKPISIFGPYHAPHIHSEYDIANIIKDISVETGDKWEHVPVLSADESIGKRNFVMVLGDAVRDVLLRPIEWNSTFEKLDSWVKQANLKSFSVVPIATTAEQLIYAELRKSSPHISIPSSKSQKSQSSSESSSASKTPKLAIIGMSGRFPGANSTDEFWNLLHQGLDVHKPAPPLHWDVKTHVDPTGTRKNTSATPFGCWLEDPAAFDARFFNISPREAPQIDPAQRLALMTAYEAIEQAGLVPDATPSTRRDRVGVFYGVTSNDWMETNSAQDIDTYFIPGGNRAFIPGRINYCFKFSGPSYAVDTACSSSLAGIHIACNSLWRGDIDTAIAGGTNVLTNPDFTAGLDRGHFLSRTGNCKTFDDTADGYCRGEGIGTVIIKRLDDALMDNDPILGLILGANTNHSAESESITRPHVGAQRAIFSRIINQAGVNPQSVSYVEMHGTGTQAGDAGEMSSVLDTFAPPVTKPSEGRKTNQPLYLGSAKANIGHGEAASGVSSLIKVLLMMQKNTIVPHCGIKTRINHRFPTDLAERNVNIALKPVAWKREDDPSKSRRVFVNNFSAAGGNSALLIEDAPVRQSPSETTGEARSHHLIAFSAKNGTSLRGNMESMLSFLESNPDVPLGQLSYTTTARRIHHPHRVMLSAPTVDSLRAQIRRAIDDKKGANRPKSAPRVMFTFTGQGALFPGMGKEMLDHFAVFRDEVYRLDHIVQSLGFESILPVIQSTDRDFTNFSPVAVHLASICLQISMKRTLSSWNIVPEAVAGHSLGEYAALNAAGVLSDSDTIYLVGKRATLLRERCTRDTHAMLVIKGSIETIAEALKGTEIQVACINSPIETVLAGSNQEIANIKGLLAQDGFDSTILKIPYAFHSSQMDPILVDLAECAKAVTFHVPQIPILCPLDGNVIESGGVINGEYLARHCREPVHMLDALVHAKKNNVVNDQTVMLEIGPHPAISAMVKATLGAQTVTLATAQRGRDMWQVLGPTLANLYMAGADIRWTEYLRDSKASHKVISLPAYSWDIKHYWMQYVNDWSLRKGDPPLMIQNSLKLESTTIHRVVEESGDSATRMRIVVEADIARKDLSPLVQGHEVDGIPLCTPSVYADIALTLGTYLLRRYRPSQEEQTVDVSDMTISKALILKAGATQQFLQAHAETEWSSQTTLIKFMSFDNKQNLHEHARCTVRFKNSDLREKLQASVSQAKAKIEALRTGIAAGTTARFNRPMVYRAIRPLARFHDDYRAIDEVVLNSNTLEATSRLSFGSVKRGGDYHTHPAIIDSLTQSCGFTMNCNDFSDLDVEVFMNHGWGSFQIFEPLDFDKNYVTYTRMEQGLDKLWHGDVVILDGDKVVAAFGQIAIQGVPRRVLKVILSIESGNKTQKPRQAEPKQTSSRDDMSLLSLPSSDAGTAALSKFTKALEIIAEESGLAIDDLTNNTVFADVGVDSLLGLTISARFKEELDFDLDFNALFYEHPTVGDLKTVLGASSISTTGVSTPQSFGTSPPTATLTGRTTPATSVHSEDSGFIFNRALQIVSEESGLALEELTDETSFADAGVDSLLSLVVVSRLRDELDLDIQHESLFLECPTVADLKRLLVGDKGDFIDEPIVSNTTLSVHFDKKEPTVPSSLITKALQDNISSLSARKQAVDDYVRTYTAGFQPPTSNPTSKAPNPNEKVILVTGATGSLGGHLVYHLSQLPDVKTVVCLNRENKADPNDRQYKAMRSKGIRFPEDLKSKILVFQTDTAKPMFGLSTSQYDALTSSVTHLIHNAWPMSAKRAVTGFEPQFQIMRNLIDFSSTIASRNPTTFKFTFQMVSSIGVVGHYKLNSTDAVTKVPESHVDIDSVLPNGYGDAKWCCERMLDATLHKHPDRFRTMAVRLGQIAGSKTSGYWNPMEHFGFLVKSSQTLRALPDTSGKAYWTPVNDVAAALSDITLDTRDPHPIYHVENPVGQDWKELNAVLADALGIRKLLPFEEWVELVRSAPQHNNPAVTLLEFLDSNYLRMSCGGLVLDVKNALEHSESLRGVGAVSGEVVRKYIHIWKEIGFLS